MEDGEPGERELGWCELASESLRPDACAVEGQNERHHLTGLLLGDGGDTLFLLTFQSPATLQYELVRHQCHVTPVLKLQTREQLEAIVHQAPSSLQLINLLAIRGLVHGIEVNRTAIPIPWVVNRRTRFRSDVDRPGSLVARQHLDI